MNRKTLELTRRGLLRSLGGAALALPFLPGLDRAGVRSANAAAPAGPHAKNFVMFTTPNGVDPLQFWPTGGERDWKASPVLEPLMRHRDKLLIVGPEFGSPTSRQPVAGSGLRFRKPNGIHRAWTATTCDAVNVPRVPQTGDGLTVKTSHPSVDQLVAAKLPHYAGRAPRFRSLELGVHPVGGDVPCIVNFAMDGSPLPRIQSDKAAWTTIFGGLMPPGTGAELLARRNAAVSGFLADRFAALTPALGKEDRMLLDRHLQALREVEGRVNGPVAAGCNAGRLMAGITPATRADATNPTSDAPALTANFQDMVALAFACDLTRVASISMSFEGGGNAGGLSHTWLGMRENHHGMSHHGGNAAKRAKYNQCVKWYAEMLARMLDQLQAHPHPDGGTLYDHTLVWWMFRHGDGNAHAHFGVPGVLAGGAGGHFGAMGRFLSRPATDFGNLHMSMVGAMGIDVAGFGVGENRSTTPIAGLRG